MVTIHTASISGESDESRSPVLAGLCALRLINSRNEVQAPPRDVETSRLARCIFGLRSYARRMKQVVI